MSHFKSGTLVEGVSGLVHTYTTPHPLPIRARSICVEVRHVGHVVWNPLKQNEKAPFHMSQPSETCEFFSP